MTSDKQSLLQIIYDIECAKISSEFDICDDLMYMLSSIDIGHNRVVRYHMANELYILLKYGPDELARHRGNSSWWG